MPMSVIVNSETAFLGVDASHLLVHDGERFLGAHHVSNIDILEACLQIEELKNRTVTSVIPAHEAFN